jgi:hypothetical protein
MTTTQVGQLQDHAAVRPDLDPAGLPVDHQHRRDDNTQANALTATQVQSLSDAQIASYLNGQLDPDVRRPRLLKRGRRNASTLRPLALVEFPTPCHDRDRADSRASIRACVRCPPVAG